MCFFQTFGALLSGPPKLSEHFYGTGESFLFTFHNEYKVGVWALNQKRFLIKALREATLEHVNHVSYSIYKYNLGGQSGAAVRRPHGNVHDVGSNPAATRNKNGHWEAPLQKVAQWSNRI